MSEDSDGDYSDARDDGSTPTVAAKTMNTALPQPPTGQSHSNKEATSIKNQSSQPVNGGNCEKGTDSQDPRSSTSGLHMCKQCSRVQVEHKEDICYKCEKEGSMDDSKSIPSFFKCLLKPNDGVMKDPVLTPSGESYEKENIRQHIDRTPQNPVNKLPLKHDQLYENKPLKEAARAYCQGKDYSEFLKCRLSKTFFRDPVTLPTGETYERNKLLELKSKKQLAKHNVRQFDENSLYLNKAVKAASELFEEKDQPPKVKDLSRPSKSIIILDIPPNMPSVVIHFHVLVPRTLWDITDSSVVRVRSGHPDLGNWDMDLVELYPERVSDSDLLQMGAKLKLPVLHNIFRQEILYAYVVYSPRASLSSEREKIYGIERSVWSRITSHGEVCRCLQLPNSCTFSSALSPPETKSETKRGQSNKAISESVSRCSFDTGSSTVFHKFDTIVYPKEEAKSIMQHFSLAKPPPPVKPDPPQEMRLKCFREYIARFTELLCTGENLSIEEICNELEFLFDSMYNEDFVIDKDHKKKKYDCIEKEMLAWIKATTDSLTNASSVDVNDGVAIVSSFIILLVIGELLKQQKVQVCFFESAVENLYHLLGRGDILNNYNLVDTMLVSSAFRMKSVCTLKFLLSSISGNSALKWICVVPYYHFLNKEVVPLAKISVEQLWQKAAGQNILPILQPNWSDRDRLSMLMEVQKLGLFHSDPHLLPLCFSICSPSSIIKCVHPLHSAHWLLLQTKGIKTWKECLNKKILAAFRELKQLLIESNLKCSDNDTDSFLKMLLEILNCLWRTKGVQITLICHGVQVTAVAASTLQVSHPMAKRILDTVTCYIQSWIKTEMITESFGGTRRNYSLEISRWNQLKTYLSQTTAAADELMDRIIIDILRQRISKIPSDLKLSVMCECSEEATYASGIVTKIVEESIADILKEVSGKEAISKMQKSRVKTSVLAKAIGIVFDHQFTSFQPSLHSLLQWDHWPDLLDLYSKYPSVLEPKYQMACDGASKCIQEMISSITNCQIVVGSLEQILREEVYFSQLVVACANIGCSEQEFRGQLSLCKSMLSAYEEHKEQLQVAVNFFSEVASCIEGYAELKEQLEKDTIDERQLNDICVQENEIFTFPIFGISSSKLEVLRMLKIMDCDYPNIFFTKAAKQKLLEVTKSQQRQPLEDVVSHVWTPAFDHCRGISDTLLDRSMTLRKVSSYFENYDRGELKRNVHDLVQGVGMCLGDDNYYNTVAVNECISAIHDFKKVVRCSRAAAELLQLKEKLALKGDFSKAEVLQNVSVNSQENLQLKDIKTDVVSAGQRLEKAAEDVNLACLRKINECCEILLWIKHIVIDVTDLQAFVNLALDTGTCGEDRWNKDRMSNLRSIGSEFAPLIFNIQPNADFEELASELDVVWAALKSNPALPQVLEACNGDKKWYEEVKNTQGNVEATSFGQLKNILNYGHFTIGDPDPKIHQQISDVVSLSMHEEDKKLPRSQYSLSELEDLESRLVLISGEDSQKQEEVDAYLKMLTLIRHIAEALLYLQQSGKIKYIGWTLRFSCRCARNALGSLSNLAVFIEEELELWKNEVESARKHFYELNYYTTKQILILRNHIKQITNDIDDPDASIVAHAQELLQSVCLDVSTDCIIEVLKNPDDPNVEQMTSTADILQHCQFPSSTEGDVFSDVSTHFSIPYTSDDSSPQSPNLQDSKNYALCTKLVEYYGFEEDVAFKAANMFDDEDEAANWCEDHQDDAMFTNQSDAQKRTDSYADVEDTENTVDEYNTAEILHGYGKHVPGDYLRQASFHSAFENESQTFKIKEANDDIANSYLSLKDLGKFLSCLSKQSGGQFYSRQRPFPRKSGLKISVPNLIVTNEENVLKTTLSLYTEDRSLPLPTPEEVLVCCESTTSEEVILLWRRAIGDPGFKRLFCLVHPEKLSYSDVDRALQQLFEFIKGKRGFRLVIVCSSIDESKSHVISKLHLYRRAYHRREDAILKDFLEKHLSTQSRARSKTTKVTASSVDKDLSTVRVIISKRAGMGKSLYARRLSQRLNKFTTSDASSGSLISVPIHGPNVTADEIISLLKYSHLDPYCKIYHFDIASSVVNKVASVLFSLLILGGLCDSQGRVWRSHISQLYCIEITLSDKLTDIYGETSTLSLLSLLPKVYCINPIDVWNRRANDESDRDFVLADKDELQTVAYQRVYQFLKKHDNSENLDEFVFCSDTQGNLQEVIQVISKYSGISNPSWREIRNFVHFLNIQLNTAETSLYLKDATEGLKTFVVQFAIRMAKDFATSSLSGEIDAEEGVETEQTTLQQLQILDRHRWEERPHPYIFFNKDRATATFVGFTVSDSGDLLNPLNKGELIEKSIASPSLVKDLKRLKFDEDHSTLSSDELVKKLCLFLGIAERENPDKSYVLTRDNFIKILGIQMRFRCGIPVVLMGETGCGKTRLIRFMCDLANTAAEDSSTLLILKVHGGTTKSDVVQKVYEAKKRAKENAEKGLDTVLFFDEANTSEAIGLIKEVLCDKQVQGQRITERIHFVAACNPYRRHTDEMIKRLESAGLGYYVKGSDSCQRLGEIPLRQLVYRVLELPPSLRPHVYDFGRLNDETEVEYTKKIVENRVCTMKELDREFVIAIAFVLASCQAYMRKKSFVSLRDVERAMIVFEFFYNKAGAFDSLIMQRAKGNQQLNTSNTQGKATRALILALSVCYHARLQDRSNFEVTISSKFTHPLYLPGKDEQFRNEILWCQEVLLNEMKIPPNIAKNVALRENVFMMTICIELRIPLFLVGKPGSSKSLAKTIVSSSLSGRSSKSELLQKFKQVHMFSFQCSKYSTPDSIVQVFKNAKSFQEKQDTNKYVSVVVLDEVGLAEDSPALPLKALHPLLEDGTEGGDDSNQIVEREKRVAFVGISNWALDPAKMNRGVMVTRGDPTTDDLVKSAMGICRTKQKDSTLERLERYFKPLANCYERICELVNKTREFYGLRDYYCLIKMLYWLCEKSSTLTSKQLEHAIRRNFGGAQDIDPWKIFKTCLKKCSLNMPREPNPLDDDKIQRYSSPDCSPYGLIYTSLLLSKPTKPEEQQKWEFEHRYLLFLTENYTALQTIYRFLSNVRSEEPSSFEEPYILFGSSFPKDKEYTQTCRNINQIKLSMETGRIVILLNLENLYESLYDALNQYYLVHGGKRYVDLGLQTHRMKCQVHQNFRLILIAETQTVYDKFPTPLINRLEKHFVLSKTLLDDWQKRVLTKLEAWIKAFISLQEHSELEETFDQFQPSDVFVGFKEDTPAAIVLQASYNTERFSSETQTLSWTRQLHSNKREKSVYMECKHLLLRICTPDAITRLRFTNVPEHEQEELNSIYYNEQCHYSIDGLLLKLVSVATNPADGLLIQVTTHSHLLDPQQKQNLESDVCTLFKNPNWKVHNFLLQEFDTEEDFMEKTRYAFEDKIENTLLLIQCDSGHLCGDLIACARYRLYDLKKKALENHCTTTHVLLIVHLPRKTHSSSFVGFQGSPWICYHLDELQAHDDDMLSTQDALQKPISELFYADAFDSEFIFPSKFNDFDEDNGSEVNKNSYHQCRRLHNCIQAAASKVQDTEDSSDRATKRIETLLQIISKSKLTEAPLNDRTFHGALVRRIKQLLVMYEEKQENTIKWFHRRALSLKKLQQSGTFRNSLSREIEEMLIMFLAGVIAAVDRHCNLDLLEFYETPREKVVYKLWIDIFLSSELCPLDFELIVSGQLPNVGSYSEANFRCKLPFSWIVRNVVTSSMEYSTVKTHTELLNEICAKLQCSLLGKLLINADFSGEADLKVLYLHDFVRSTYRCTRRTQGLSDMEFELCQAALNGVCREFLKSTDAPLLRYIAAIHIIYAMFETQFSWFSETVSNCPGLLKDLKALMDQIEKKTFLALPAYAVNQALVYLIEDLDTALVNGKQKKLISWIEKAQKLRETTESVLNWSQQSDDICTDARHRWQQASALQMLIEHVISKNDSLIHYARRLLLPLKTKDADLSKEATFTRVVNLLGKLSVVLQKRNMGNSLTEGVTLFFMEMTSNMCFGVSPPEEAVINTVVAISLSPSSTEFAVDTNSAPALRIFLLQQLLKYEYQQAAKHLQMLFEQAETNHRLTNTECVQLQIYCTLVYENTLHRKTSEKEDFSGQISKMKQLIDADHFLSSQSKADSILGVAELRFSLSQFIDLLQHMSNASAAHTPSCLFELISAIQELRKRIPQSALKFSDIISTFLLRAATRKYGYSSLVGKNGMQNILDSSGLLLGVHNYDDRLINPFVVHDPQYSAMREAIDEAVYTAKGHINLGSLSLTQSNAVPFLLALYEKVTLASIDARQYIDEAQEGLLKFMLSNPCEQLSDAVRNTAEKMIKNQFENHLRVKLDIPPTQKLVSALVVHAASVFMCMKEETPLVGLFVRLLNPSSDLNDSYLPTMPDVFECPNQHQFIAPFKRAMECSNSLCKIAPVQSMGVKSLSRPGYLLGPVQACCDIPCGQRSLQPASVHIIRTLMHAALYWACSDSELLEAQTFALKFLEVDTATTDLQQFCWDHLEHDLSCVSKAIGRSIDEAVLLVHMILEDIFNKPFQGKDKPDDALSTQHERMKWEEKFDAMYLMPILQGLEAKLQTAIHKNQKKEHDDLYHAIFERLTDVSEETQWSYFPQLTIEQLSHVIYYENAIPFNNMPSTLKLFLQQEPLLRAIQYLPAIVKWQQYMHEKFHCRVTNEEVKNSTVHEFFQQTEQESLLFSQECQELYNDIKAAWNLVKETLCHYVSSCLPVKVENLPTYFDEDTSIELLIPTTKGRGICTTILVKFLVHLHNSFIQECNELIAQSWKESRSSISKKEMADQPRPYRRTRTVRLSHIQHCNLLCYEQDIISVVFLHCYQSRPFVWHFHNLPALEKHILHKFVHGKPIITEEIPLVVFKQETTDKLASNIANIRQNVQQKELPLRIKQDISAELDEVQKLHETFEDIEIVLHFLGTSGKKLKPSLPLRQYFEETLNMKKRPFSSKVKEHCNLEHILSLWRTLGKNLAKHHLLTGQEPFECVPDQFDEEFVPDVKEDYDKMIASVDGEEFLSILYEVIMTAITNSQLYKDKDDKESRSLVKHVLEYIHENNLTQIEKLSEEFPKNVPLRQAVGVWKYTAYISW